MHLGHFRSCSLPCVSRNPGSFQPYRTWEFLLNGLDKYGEQAIKQFVGELLRIRSHESNTKSAGLCLGTKIFLCPITARILIGFGTGWLRVESQGLLFRSCKRGRHPHDSTNCPWVSEDSTKSWLKIQ